MLDITAAVNAFIINTAVVPPLTFRNSLIPTSFSITEVRHTQEDGTGDGRSGVGGRTEPSKAVT